MHSKNQALAKNERDPEIRAMYEAIAATCARLIASETMFTTLDKALEADSH